MKALRIILFIFTLCVFLCGCKNISVTPADELLCSEWYVKNESGVEAQLTFDINTCSTTFTVYNSDNNLTEISGTFAVDNNHLYIISEELMKQFEFSYKVYSDRLELTYNGNTIEMRKNKPQ